MGLHEAADSARISTLSAWLIPAVIVIGSILIALTGDVGREALRYDRVWLGQGEVWRLLTGHFAHLSWSHLALNSAGLLLVWYLIGQTHALRDWVLIVVFAIASMDAAFWILNPALYWYVGMSGLLHGLLAAGIVARLGSFDVETTVLLVLLAMKIGWEQFAGPVPGSESTSGGPVVVDAHLYGALGGVLGALFVRIRVGARAAI